MVEAPSAKSTETGTKVEPEDGSAYFVSLSDRDRAMVSELDLLKPGNRLVPDPNQIGPGFLIVEDGRAYATIMPEPGHPIPYKRSVKEVLQLPLTKEVIKKYMLE